MSSIYRYTRERWAARSMTLHRWLKNPQERVNYREPICEVMADGQRLVVDNDEPYEVWGIYRHMVRAGEEVAPWGDVLRVLRAGERRDTAS